MVSVSHRYSFATTRWRSVDLWLLVGPVLVALVGVVMVYTATRSILIQPGYSPTYFLKRQLLFVVIGTAVMVAVSFLDYRRLEQFATAIYVGSIGLLLAVMVPGIGSNRLGATRWIPIGPLQIQPSELSVLALIIAVSTYVSRRPEGLNFRDLTRILLMAAVPMGLIYLQPDLGTAIIGSIVILVMLVVAGLPLRYVAGLVGLAIIAVVLAIELGVLKKYQVERLTSFLNQGSTDPLLQRVIYNVQQAKLAIGAGGLWGSGIGHGAVTNLGYVPEQQTDFIFTAVGEQLGFIGATGVLVALGSIAWRILHTAQVARDSMGRMLAAGMFAFFTFSCFQNAGMTMGIMPVTGIPLPFLSYGGSAALCFFTAMGIVASVSARRGI